MIVLVLLVYLVAPEYVIDYSAYGGAWRGLSTYKNTFGEHMAVAVLLLALVRFRRFFWLRYVFLLIAAGFLFLSRILPPHGLRGFDWPQSRFGV